MGYHIQEGLDESFFQDRIDAVMDRIDGLDGIDVEIVVMDRPRQCKTMLGNLPVADEDAFIDNCEDALTSVSYRADGEEIIVIKADKEFIKENEAALRGLLAHELMHVVHRHDGTEDAIQQTAKQYADPTVQALRQLGLDDGQIGGFFGTVYATAIFCLKDIYDNAELIEQGFTSDIEEYYYNMLGLEGYCRVPDFYGREATLEDVEQALAFELGLLPAWLPFRTLNRDMSDTIRNRIQDCYERDIPDVAADIHQLVDLYEELWDQPQVFKDKFFEQVIDSSTELIAEKIENQG